MKHKKLLLLLFACIILCVAIIVAYANSEEESEDAPPLGDLSVTFFPLGGKSVGDCCIIRYQDKQILIDAGAGNLSSGDVINTIVSQMNTALSGDKDKVWDYVIVTHGDADHINAFSTNEDYDKDTGVIHEMRKRHNVTFDTLIDFDTVIEEDQHIVDLSAKESYKRYVKRRKDSFANYFTASALCGGKAHDISLGEDCTLTILYNRFYDQTEFPSGTSESAKQNLLSVCVMLTYGERSFLFTGDLEEYDSGNNYAKINGETYLLADNKSYFEKGVSFFKAGHHGSRTSSSADFIHAIRPQFVVIPTVAGTSEYHTNTPAGAPTRFPAQEVLSSFLKYTDAIYIPTKAVLDDNGATKSVENYHGKITLYSDGTKIIPVTEGENDAYGDPLPITKTAWFSANRQDTGGLFKTYVLELPENVKGIGRCTLLKYRNTEILIDSGIQSDNISQINTMYFVDKILPLCADGKLEYSIINTSLTKCMSNTIGTYTKKGPNHDGIFGTFEIKNLIDFGENTNYSNPSATSWLKRYYEQREELIANGTAHNAYNSSKNGVETYNAGQGITLYILNRDPFPSPKNEADYSLVTIVDFHGERLVFTGTLTNEEEAEEELVAAHASLLTNATFFLAGNNGYRTSNSEALLKVISPEYTVVPTLAGIKLDGKTFLDKTTADRLWIFTDRINGQRHIYLTSQYLNGRKSYVCGDITFTMDYHNGTISNKTIEGSHANTLLTDSNWYNQQK